MYTLSLLNRPSSVVFVEGRVSPFPNVHMLFANFLLITLIRVSIFLMLKILLWLTLLLAAGLHGCSESDNLDCILWTIFFYVMVTAPLFSKFSYNYD